MVHLDLVEDGLRQHGWMTERFHNALVAVIMEKLFHLSDAVVLPFQLSVIVYLALSFQTHVCAFSKEGADLHVHRPVNDSTSMGPVGGHCVLL